MRRRTFLGENEAGCKFPASFQALTGCGVHATVAR